MRCYVSTKRRYHSNQEIAQSCKGSNQHITARGDSHEMICLSRFMSGPSRTSHQRFSLSTTSCREENFIIRNRNSHSVDLPLLLSYVIIIAATGTIIKIVEIWTCSVAKNASSGMLRGVTLIRTDVSEEISASIITVTSWINVTG
jgi:hypothetical protein